MPCLIIHRQSKFVNDWFAGFGHAFEALRKRGGELRRQYFTHVLAEKLFHRHQEIPGLLEVAIEIDAVNCLDKHEVRQGIQNRAVLGLAHRQRRVRVPKLQVLSLEGRLGSLSPPPLHQEGNNEQTLDH